MRRRGEDHRKTPVPSGRPEIVRSLAPLRSARPGQAFALVLGQHVQSTWRASADHLYADLPAPTSDNFGYTNLHEPILHGIGVELVQRELARIASMLLFS